jgi:hypothetical protein
MEWNRVQHEEVAAFAAATSPNAKALQMTPADPDFVGRGRVSLPLRDREHPVHHDFLEPEVAGGIG